MNSAALPKEKASEPEEEARQPSVETKMLCNQPKKLTFAKNVDLTEKPPSQISSSYKVVLSQPPLELSHSERLIWLQKRRTAGLWVQCDECDRWRYLPNVLDRHELPKKWYCRMNTDPEFASCSVPEAPLRLHDEEDLIHSEYAAGSLVWARLGGWPWWPAMVDDCPDTEQYYWLDGFSDIPTHYNVVFFDAVEVTRAWIAPEQLKPYSSNKEMTKLLLKNKKYYNRLKAAIAQANEAEKVPLEIRLARFSFIARHKGKVISPKKPEKKDLKKYQKQLKKKFNVDFPIESSDSDDDTVEDFKAMQKNNNNVIILGTPKKRARKENKCSEINDQSVEENNLPGDINIQKPNNTETQNSTNVESFCNGNKPSNSMIVQIGSTEADSIDNDTSATYVPESATEQLNLTIRMDTPNSDDFDF
ncbi:zinc finger CW-type PWWP domain protein 1-like [Helicoverpa zea]|uniref:zinc finger CW-type PWWP domain protein 1-like n=1 Tax=Helicoverpa zea TaxID=7113 RepID=UPI001F5A5A79|nr:zinc finger CW-type PWWP domain protein 1-like [Helicoverpa zea]